MSNLYVNNFLVLDNLSGDTDTIQGDPTEPNTDDWLEAEDLDEDVEMHGEFENPDSDLDGEQTVQLRLRSSDNDVGDPALATVELLEDGSVFQTVISEQEITQDQDGELIEGTFDATELSNPDALEVRVSGDSTGGMPGTRDTVEIGRIRWVAGLLIGIEVETNEATDVGFEEATLNGELTTLSGFDSADVWFEWGEDGSGLPNSTPEQTLSDAQTFDETISGLSEGTTYEFRAHAESDDESMSDEGSILTFTTEERFISVVTEPATDIDHDEATLHGELDRFGTENPYVWFEIVESGSSFGQENDIYDEGLHEGDWIDGYDSGHSGNVRSKESDHLLLDAEHTDGAEIAFSTDSQIQLSPYRSIHVAFNRTDNPDERRYVSLDVSDIDESHYVRLHHDMSLSEGRLINRLNLIIDDNTDSDRTSVVDSASYTDTSGDDKGFEIREVWLANTTPKEIVSGSSGTDTFNETVQALDHDTEYEYRAYGEIDDGTETDQGDPVAFWTLPVVPAAPSDFSGEFV